MHKPLTETERKVVEEAMVGAPLRLRALAETLAQKGCGVKAVKTKVLAVAKAMGVEDSPRCPHCYSINTTVEGDGWKCCRVGCLASFTKAETTAADGTAKP